MRYRAKTSILKKLLFTVTAALLVCTVLVSGSVYFYMKPFLESTLQDKRQAFAENMVGQLIQSLEGIATYAQNISFDDTVQTFFQLEDDGSYDYYSEIYTLEKKLKQYRMVYGDVIRDIVITDCAGNVLETRTTYQSIFQEEPYCEFVGEDGKRGYIGYHSVDYQGLTGKLNTIAYVSEIRDINEIEIKYGRVFLLLDADTLLGNVTSDEELEVRLTGNNGEILVDTFRDESGERYTAIENGWVTDYRISSQETSQIINKMSLTVILIVLVSLVLVLLIVIQIVRNIVKPLDVLIGGMKNVARGSRNESIEIHTGDECEQAANVFNDMIRSIMRQEEELLKSEKKQHAAQLTMLNYQLNPHFIYNTLNAIICLARQQKCSEIICLTRDFITLLQALLRTDLQAMTTVEKEQKDIDNYVRILQVCYRNIPDIKWKIQEGLEQAELPRMILYPLVENSVFHGIVPGEDAQLLEIRIYEKEQRIYVEVEDDGVGCTEEEMQQIRDRLGESSVRDHIGLFNVNGRLKLIYKEEAPLEIMRGKERGTVIYFSFCTKSIRKDKEV